MINLFTSGKPLNFRNKIIAKCTFDKLPIPDRTNRALIINGSDYAENELYGYAAMLTNKHIDHNHHQFKMPVIQDVRQIDHLTEGDVISINGHTGSIRTLYRRNSNHNSLFLTENCNSHCLMCSQPPIKSDDRNRIWEIVELIQLIDKDTEHLGITGGEPTLLHDDLFRIIESLKSSLPDTSVTMLTNGRMFYYNSFTENFAQLEHPSFVVAIPLYSAIPEEHDYIVQADDAFVETIKGIYNLGKLNQRIEIRFVIHALTYKCLPSLAEYIYYNLPFVSHVALMGLEIMGYARKNLDMLWIDPVDYQNELESAVEFLSIRNINVSIYNHQLCVLRKSLWPYAQKSISDWKNIYLDECARCSVLEQCGGLFKSSHRIHSEYIRPL